MTFVQVSDALQEFLCLADQAKLVKYDTSKLRELAQTNVERSTQSLTKDINNLVKQVLVHGKGLPRVEISRVAESLDTGFLD